MTVPAQNVEHHLDTITTDVATLTPVSISELLDFAEVIA